MSTTRRTFLQTTALAAAAAQSANGAEKPNVLFVLADQWRSTAFGFGSDAIVRTPHIDRLARQGASCTRAYAANPVCTPNRTCILTGRYSHQTGMIKNDIQMPPSERCWPEAFADAGYATHYIGKWHLDGPPKPGFVPPGWRRRGFQTFEGFNRGHVYHETWGFEDDGRPLAKRAAAMDPYYEPTLQTDLALDFMRRHRDEPFVCFLSWGPPHTPFRPPTSHDLYEAGEIQLRENVPAKHRERAIEELVGYYGLCESLDHEMGRLMDYLEESGLADNTLVVFTSDHGELAGSHGKYRKGEPEEESLHVPLTMRFPGRIAPGTQSTTLFNSVDLMPTLLALCGLPASDTVSGRDLSAAVLESEESPAVESLYSEGKVNALQAVPSRNSPQGGTWRTVVTQRHKLTARLDYGQVEQLYDLQEDPFELRNLAGKREAQRLENELLTELRDWGKRTEDPFPGKPWTAKESYPDPSG